MIYEVVVPDLGATGDGMKLTAWLVKPDAFVRAGSPLFAVTTDKADVEVEAFRDGYIRKILVDADSPVTLGTVVAVLADSLEESLADSSPDGTAESPGTRDPQGIAKGLGAAAPEQKCESPESGHVLASPLARRERRGKDSQARHSERSLSARGSRADSRTRKPEPACGAPHPSYPHAESNC
jgi:pyruvate dehydrogenase E2 component (dihydrolipoamide acetyltransferase)